MWVCAYDMLVFVSVCVCVRVHMRACVCVCMCTLCLLPVFLKLCCFVFLFVWKVLHTKLPITGSIQLGLCSSCLLSWSFIFWWYYHHYDHDHVSQKMISFKYFELLLLFFFFFFFNACYFVFTFISKFNVQCASTGEVAHKKIHYYYHYHYQYIIPGWLLNNNDTYFSVLRPLVQQQDNHMTNLLVNQENGKEKKKELQNLHVFISENIQHTVCGFMSDLITNSYFGIREESFEEWMFQIREESSEEWMFQIREFWGIGVSCTVTCVNPALFCMTDSLLCSLREPDRTESGHCVAQLRGSPRALQDAEARAVCGCQHLCGTSVDIPWCRHWWQADGPAAGSVWTHWLQYQRRVAATAKDCQDFHSR